MKINFNQILIGQDKDGTLITADMNEDGTIRTINDYVLIHKSESYDENYYITCWGCGGNATVNDITYGRGMKLAENHTPFFHDEEVKQIILSEDFYEASGSFCSECGTFHDTEQYYDHSFIITEDCEVLCKTCATIEDQLVTVESAEDIFNSRDLTGMEFASEDYEEVETLFCDSTGFGRSTERAMTKEQAEARAEDLIEQYGELYAGLTGIGQFQVYVTLYKKTA